MEYSTDPNQNLQQYQDPHLQQQSAYDPTQYDQSTGYYAYPSQQQFTYEQYQFYPPQGSYTQHPQPYPQIQQESGSIHPPGVVPVQQVYYHQTSEPVESQGVNLGSGSESGGFFPAAASAAVAVSQAVNYPGNMDAVQRPKFPPQSAYKGRRGGRSFQGGGRGRSGHHGPRRGGSAAPSHNRGRGRGNGRYFHQGAAPAIQNPTSVPSENAFSSVPAPAPVPSQAPAALAQQSARCELCNADCNSLQILEQHLNGKRHKKKVLMHEQSQKLNKVVTEKQNVQPMPSSGSDKAVTEKQNVQLMPSSSDKAVTEKQNVQLMPSSGSEALQLEKVGGCEEKQLQQDYLLQLDYLPLDVTADRGKEPEQLKDTEECSAAAATVGSPDAKRKSREQDEPAGRGSKRKKSRGQGSKHMKSSQGPRRPVEPPKPKEVIPFICELCNVKCETLMVFNSHLSGKKHLTNLKKNGFRAGAPGLQAHNPLNYDGSSSSFPNPQVQQPLADPQAILAQLITFVLSQTQAQGLIAPHLPPPEALLASMQAPFAGTGIPTQYAHHLQTQGPLAMLADRNNNVAPTESGNQQQDLPQPAATDANVIAENHELEPEKKALRLPQDNSVMAPPENSNVGALEVLLPSTTSNIDVSAPEEPVKVPAEEMKEEE